MALAEALATSCGIVLGVGVLGALAAFILGPYRIGKRRYRSMAELVKHVSGVIGLAPTREDGAFPALGDVGFRGPLPSGRRAQVRFYTRTHGSTSTTYVLLTVTADVTPDLTIKLENLFHKVGKVIGVTSEIEVGDLPFDKRFLLVTTEPERAQKALSPGFRSAVVKLFDEFRVIEVVIREGTLTAELGVDSTGADQYPRILELLEEGAKTLDR